MLLHGFFLSGLNTWVNFYVGTTLGSSGLLFAEEVMNMNVSWTELLTFCLVILEVIELLVQITKKK